MYPHKFIFVNNENCDIDINNNLEEATDCIVYGSVKMHDTESPIGNVIVSISKSLSDKEKNMGFTITDENGDFSFGPICEDDNIIIKAWVKRINYVK